MTPREQAAERLIRLAKSVMAADEDEELDPRFVEKIRALKTGLPKLTRMKRKKLGQLGIGPLRASNTVEDLVDALANALASA